LDDIKSELFEGDNVVMTKTDNGLSEIRQHMKETITHTDDDIVIVNETPVETPTETQSETPVETQSETQSETPSSNNKKNKKKKKKKK
jgi:hypothetical protein